MARGMGLGRGGRWRALAGAALLASPATAPAQHDAPADHDDIVVTGKRLPGSAIGDTEPVAVLDAAAIGALGITSLADMLRLIRPLTTSASGGDPMFLLNGRRISGFGEIQALPPEAIERTEILPEKDAARFGLDWLSLTTISTGTVALPIFTPALVASLKLAMTKLSASAKAASGPVSGSGAPMRSSEAWADAIRGEAIPATTAEAPTRTSRRCMTPKSPFAIASGRTRCPE